MNRLRAFFLRNRGMAVAVIALALAMKALVPAGYMIGGEAHVLTVRICDGYADSEPHFGQAVVLVAKGQVGKQGDAGKSLHDQQACPFSALGHAGLAGADPIQLALALAFILVLGVAGPAFPAPRPFSRLRPPLRAPPALV
ncbi:hypothetical protein AQZ50_07100 [Novosphingobium sp. Fuku2-ISO-50]|nr:hypothetical protein AQZ50_07100 [Novosphingobium sp. Fuku2-ISO-50]